MDRNYDKIDSNKRKKQTLSLADQMRRSSALLAHRLVSRNAGGISSIISPTLCLEYAYIYYTNGYLRTDESEVSFHGD